jgi:hypothetical protein
VGAQTQGRHTEGRVGPIGQLSGHGADHLRKDNGHEPCDLVLRIKHLQHKDHTGQGCIERRSDGGRRPCQGQGTHLLLGQPVALGDMVSDRGPQMDAGALPVHGLAADDGQGAGHELQHGVGDGQAGAIPPLQAVQDVGNAHTPHGFRDPGVGEAQHQGAAQRQEEAQDGLQSLILDVQVFCN